jgi:hypothetical protein
MSSAFGSPCQSGGRRFHESSSNRSKVASSCPCMMPRCPTADSPARVASRSSMTRCQAAPPDRALPPGRSSRTATKPIPSASSPTTTFRRPRAPATKSEGSTKAMRVVGVRPLASSTRQATASIGTTGSQRSLRMQRLFFFLRPPSGQRW